MIKLTKETFEKEVLRSKGTVVVFMKKENCGNCVKMLPIFEKFAEENELIKCCLYVVESKTDPIYAKFPIKTMFPGIAYFVDGKHLVTLESLQGPGMLKLPMKSLTDLKALVYDQIALVEAATPYIEQAEKAKKNIDAINNIILSLAQYSDKNAQVAAGTSRPASVTPERVKAVKEAAKSLKAETKTKPKATKKK